jgi:glycosyltransferase involved in cell wall biosynthesis
MVFQNMRVAIDAGPLDSGHKVRGVGFYTKSLIESLQNLNINGKRLNIDAFNFEKEPMKVKTGYYDIVHIPYFDPFRITIPKEKSGKLIITIHDVTPLIYPNHYVPGIRGQLQFAKYKKLLKDVDAIITDTETSKKDIVRLLDIPEKKVVSIYLAPRSLFIPIKDRKSLVDTQKKYKLPNKFVLYVGDVNYNKNVATLIKACDIADVSLVIVGKQAMEIKTINNMQKTIKGPRDIIRMWAGKPHPEEAHWKELEELFEKKHVMRLGFVPDEELVEIFNLATLYCQPSFYEGFGLVPLEAMASGTAVLNAKTQSLVEVAGDAAIYADPKNEKEMAKQIERIFRDSYLRADLIRKGERRVKEFSWDKTAHETLQVYEGVYQDERKIARRAKNSNL